jgi:D-alanyl-D-alanine carboxypeptidase (penicillin-binding protein 5/6)
MFKKLDIAIIRKFAAVALVAIALNLSSAFAQENANANAVAEDALSAASTATGSANDDGTNANDGLSAAKQAYIIDFDTGAVLLEKNAHERMPTSSMSKTITMFAVFSALKDGKLSLDADLPVSERAWRMGGSKMFVEVNNRINVEDLIRGVIVQSGNDATVVLAEGVAGTEEGFADLLNSYAKEIGMNDSNFRNASGWPDDNHYSTAHDLTLLGVSLIKNFPEYYKYYSEREFTYNNIRQPNRNPVLYRNIGADGIKTGYTDKAGYGLMASGVRDGRRVVMTLNGMENPEMRANESTRLLDWALRSFTNYTVAKPGEAIETAAVAMGTKESVGITVEKDVVITVPNAMRRDLKVSIKYMSPIIAPIAKGQSIGVMTVEVPRMGTYEFPVVANEDVPKLGFFTGTLTKLRYMLLGK